MIHQIKDFPHTAFIGIGTNEGDKLANIRFALSEIDESDSSSIENVSSICETLPMGEVQQENFLNAVIKIKTKLLPEGLFLFLKSIEKKAGRIKRERWGPRELDLDILFYDDIIYNKNELIIPHSGVIERDFVLVPLIEIEPHLIHPISKVELSELLNELKTKNILNKIHENIKAITV
ncbi:MAG: 2-amino-4-hydroxy-6-hydroxymethyldihydropteridine diphosphokinase [Ignavibacteriales bacterium]|nr:2-amino-4-hydroxy-6-hydroxymethyldihydropteridine diphosphokinase [Ignavibacteriales bacterium]